MVGPLQGCSALLLERSAHKILILVSPAPDSSPFRGAGDHFSIHRRCVSSVRSRVGSSGSVGVGVSVSVVRSFRVSLLLACLRRRFWSFCGPCFWRVCGVGFGRSAFRAFGVFAASVGTCEEKWCHIHRAMIHHCANCLNVKVIFLGRPRTSAAE